MKLSNNFSGAKMNKDLDERYIQKGEMTNAENIRVGNSEGSEVGSIENSLGNLQLTNIDLGTNVKTLGSVSDTFEDKIYWFVKSDTVSAVLEWDDNNNTLSKILFDSSAGVLNFNEDYLITGVNILVDSDNNRRFLLWTDNLNPPRKVNIERAKMYGDNNFTNDDISVIQKPPISAPTIELLDVPTQVENRIEEKFLIFAYRYRYEDEEVSALSPYSEVAFEPKQFVYDYSTGTNEAMVNKFNSVKINFNTGGSLVKGIDLIFKEVNSNVESIIETFDKEQENWADNDTISFIFSDNKGYNLLDGNQNNRLYDNVPRVAASQEVINNRLIYGNFLENYDIADANGDDIKVDFSASLTTTSINDLNPVKSLKSNREYEFGIVYLDAEGRMTTPITSASNTISIPNENCDKRNRAVMTINSLPPSFATHFKFFIKQEEEEYDTLTPVIFHQDGVFVWIKLEGNDIDKVSKGQFLYVKSDTSGILEESVQIEVLEVTTQPNNFLEDDSVTDIVQDAGVYIKIKPTNFALNQNSAEVYDYEGKGFKSRNTDNNITGNQNYIEDPIYYGFNGIDDLNLSGTYTGTEDIRYIVEIDATGTPDTFRWSDDDGASYTSGVSITGAPQALNNGVTVQFDNTTGHNTSDNWIISAKADDEIAAGNSSRNAWAVYQGKPKDNESIIAGAQIIISYNETRDSSTIQNYRTTFIATQNYSNIEEWFHRDNIISQIQYPTSLDKVFFRRGTPVKTPPETMEIDPTGDMFMIFQSNVGYSGAERITIPVTLEIVELENNIIFETKPVRESEEIFYELQETYSISGGFHQGQTGSTPAIIVLPDFNCFAWSNGFESYKVRDKLTESYFKFNTRPSIPIPNYRANRRISSLIYGGVYEQTSNYNRLNEFNVGQVITKDLDDRYGSIQKLFTRDTDMLVFQEDKIHKILYNKSILFNADGSGNVSQNENVLGQEVAFSGEYGISKNPESFAFFGNRIYFVDAKRGVVLRLATDGITEISDYGMRDFFRDYFISTGDNKRFGSYDPYFDQYVLNIKAEAETMVNSYECDTQFQKFNETETFVYTLALDSLVNSIDIGYTVTTGSININVNYDGSDTASGTVTGTGTLNVPKNNTAVDTATVTITVVSSPATYDITNGCTFGTLTTVKEIILNDLNDLNNDSGTIRYAINPPDTFYLNSRYTFQESGVTRFNSTTGLEGVDNFPEDGDTVQLSIFYDEIADSDFDTSLGNRLGYLVTTSDLNQADLSTILSSATFPAVNESPVMGTITYDISFTFNKPTQDHKLYLIWDFTDTAVVANDDTASVFQGQFVDVNVLNNDTYSGEGSVLISTPSTNGSLSILFNNVIRYTHNGLNLDPDSFVYQLDNGASTDTATVNITVLEDTSGVGGGGAQGLGFNISTTGNSDPETACAISLGSVRFHDGASSYPTLDDYVYTDINKTIVFDGGDLWYSVDNSRALKIQSNGRIISTYFCGQSGGGGFQ